MKSAREIAHEGLRYTYGEHLGCHGDKHISECDGVTLAVDARDAEWITVASDQGKAAMDKVGNAGKEALLTVQRVAEAALRAKDAQHAEQIAALREEVAAASTEGRVAGLKTADAMLSGLRMKLTELRADLAATRKELGEAVGLLRRRYEADGPHSRDWFHDVGAWLLEYDRRQGAGS